MTTDYHIATALREWTKAKKIAVQNFCWSAPADKVANRVNLKMDARLYSWNTDTVNAIEYVLQREGKI